MDTETDFDLQRILEAARVPEHSVPLMEAVSGGSAFTLGAYLFFAADDWLMAIGYPLRGDYSPKTFEAALDTALQRTGATDCWAIAPQLPSRLRPYQTDEDIYFVLPASSQPPARLRRPLERAEALLRVETSRTFTAEHRRLWAAFMGQTPLRPHVRELFASTEALLASGKGDLRLLNAFDAENRLSACLLLDFTPEAFCSYVIGAHAREYPVPYASDLLFRHMLALARKEGKDYIHLGLGVNEGIRRFKRKWGGVSDLPYAMASWKEQPAQRVSLSSTLVESIARSFLDASPDLTKRQILASLPEQRPFAMLWKLEKEGRVSWIGGTAHFFCYSFEYSLRELFEQVDTVLFEGPLDPETLNEVARIGHDPEKMTQGIKKGATLDGLLTEDEICCLERVVQGPQGWLARLLHAAYPNPTEVRPLLVSARHWCAFFSLWTGFLERRGWRQSVDLEAWRVAEDMGKTVMGMESLEEQVASLEQVPIPRILRFFRDCGQWDSYMKRNVNAYLKGDLEGMLGTSTEFPSRTEQIISHRDHRFRERMRPFIEKGRCVVFVGAAHMLNLRSMLEEDGFTVSQVFPTWRHRLAARLRRK